jgi:hypothetical protein
MYMPPLFCLLTVLPGDVQVAPVPHPACAEKVLQLPAADPFAGGRTASCLIDVSELTGASHSAT